MGTGASRGPARPAPRGRLPVSARIVLQGRSLREAPRVLYWPRPAKEDAHASHAFFPAGSSSARGADEDASVLDLVHAVERAPTTARGGDEGIAEAEKAEAGLVALQQCRLLFERAPTPGKQELAVRVQQAEGELLHRRGEVQAAKQAYGRVITLAEGYFARQAQGSYPVLKRYVRAMVGLAKIWYGQPHNDEREGRGEEEEGDHATDGQRLVAASFATRSTSFGSLMRGSIRSEASDRFPAANFARLSQPNALQRHVEAGLVPAGASVPYGRMERKLIAMPCELLLIRCCEVVEMVHNYQSELLIAPLLELARIYEDVQLYARAKLIVQRCLGTLCSVYDYDYPWVVQLTEHVRRLDALLRKQLIHESATKIQATWKMYCAMCALEHVLGHPVHRYVWVPSRCREKPDLNVINSFVKDKPLTEGWEEGDAAYWGDLVMSSVGESFTNRQLFQGASSLVSKSSSNLKSELASIPQVANAIEVDRETSSSLLFEGSINSDAGGMTVFSRPDMLAHATSKESGTDTCVQRTEMGNAITVCTTTRTKIVTKAMSNSFEGRKVEVADVTKDVEKMEVSETQSTPMKRQIKLSAGYPTS